MQTLCPIRPKNDVIKIDELWSVVFIRACNLPSPISPGHAMSSDVPICGRSTQSGFRLFNTPPVLKHKTDRSSGAAQ
jgi:hypothetical protein